MSKNKWEKFHNTHSSLDISKPNTGEHNLQADWERESAREGGTYINGKSLKAYAPYFNNFKDETDVEDFFREIILHDMTCSESEKDKIVDYLKTTFHQGGLQFPVSSALTVFVTPDFGLRQPEKRVNIVTTPTGIKIEEKVEVKEVVMLKDEYLEKIYKNGKLIANPDSKPGIPLVKIDRESGMALVKPDQGKDYILKAEGTINVDFSKFSENSNQPTIQIESNTISYDNSIIQNIMKDKLDKLDKVDTQDKVTKLDKKSLGQIIVDFLKNVFGLNKVKNISPVSSTISDSDSHSEKKDNTPKF